MTRSYIRSIFTCCLSYADVRKEEPNLSAGRFKRRHIRLITLEDRTLPTADTFINPLGGEWSLGSNWSLGAPPTSTEDAIVTPGSSETVTHDSGTDSVNNLTSDGSLLISGGSITVGAALSGEVQVAGSGQLDLAGTTTLTSNVTLMLSGGATVDIPGSIVNTGQTLTVSGTGTLVLTGTLTGGTLNCTDGATLLAERATLNGVTLNGDLTSYTGLNVYNGFTLNGTATSFASVDFFGTQTLGGNGTFFLYTEIAYNALSVQTANTVLTIGPNINIDATGYIGYDPNLSGGSANVGVINQGTIEVNSVGGGLYLDASPFTNQGSVEAADGILDLVNGVGGAISIGSGGYVTGTLSGATLTGAETVDDGTSLTVTNGLTLDGIINLGDSTGYGYLNFSGTQTFNGTGTVIFGTNSTSNALIESNSGATLTIGPNITIEGDGGYIGYDPNISGSTSAVSVINQGLVSAMGGGSIYLDAGTAWTNQGTLQINGGTLDLLEPMGGTINGLSSGKLIGALNDATLTGTLTLSGNAAWTITNGLIVNGTLTLGNITGYGDLNFSGTQTVGGGGTIAFGSQSNENALSLSTSATTLTIASNLTVQGLTGYVGYDPNLSGGSSSVTVINQGIINANNSNYTIYLDAGTAWNNQGTLEENGGTLDLVSTIIGGTIRIASGSTLSGNLSGVTLTGSPTVSGSNRLLVTNGLTINGILTLGNSGGYGFLEFSGSQTVGGSGTVFFGSPSSYNALILATSGTTLTIGPNLTIHGFQGYIGYDPNLGGPSSVSVINEGTINADTIGYIIYLDAATAWTNQGLLEENAGILDLVSTISGGTINVAAGGDLSGTISGVTLNGSATVTTSTLSITKGLTLNGNITLGSGNPGILDFYSTESVTGTGTITFGSTSTSNAVWVPNSGTTLTIGSGITIEGQTGYIGYDPNLSGGSTTVSVINQGTVDANVGNGIIYLDAATAWTNQGTLLANGGTLNFVSPVSGTINVSAGGSLLGSLSAATITGSLTISGSNKLIITNGLTLNANLTLGGSSGYGVLDFSGTQTLGGTGTITFGSTSTSNALWVPTSGTTLTIGSGITVQGQTCYIGYDPNLSGGSTSVSVINQGTVDANTSGGIFYLYVTTWTNQNLIEAANGGELYLYGTVSGGTIALSSGGTIAASTIALSGVTLNGSFTLDGSHYWTITNGLTVNGTLILGDSTGYGYLVLSGTQTLGGTGTINFGSTSGLNALYVSTAGTTLTIASGITVEGQTGYIGYDTAIVGGSSTINIDNLGTVDVNSSGGIIYLYATGWTNQGTVEATNGGELYLYKTLTGGTITISSTSKLAGSTPTLSGVTLDGNLTIDGNSNWTITNGLTLNGTISLGDSTGYGDLYLSGTQTLNGAGGITFGSTSTSNALIMQTASTTLTIGSGILIQGQTGYIGYDPIVPSGTSSASVVNQGTVDADSSGAIIYIYATGWTNQGTLEATNSGELYLYKTLAGGILSLSTGGTLTGSSPTLSGVTFDGSLIIDANSFWTITNGLTLNGAIALGDSTGYGYLDFSGTQSLNGTGTITFGSSSTSNALFVPTSGTTLTIGSGITVQGQTGYIGYDPNLAGGSSNVTVINQGTINADVSGGTIYLDAAGIGGTINGSGGKLAGALSGATLTGSFVISGNNNLAITNGLTLNATLTLGDSTGSGGLEFSGTQTLGGNGTVVFGTGSTSNAVWVQKSGTTLSIGQNITIDGETGYIGYDPNITGGSSTVSVISQAAISASISGYTIYLDSSPASASWTNQGALQAANGGTLDLVTATGGAINVTSGGKLAGILSGATLTGSVTIATNTSLTVENGLILNGTITLGSGSTYGYLICAYTETLSGTGTITFGSTNAYNALWEPDGAYTLTIGSGITIHGLTGYIGEDPNLSGGATNISVINQGTISADGSGGTIYLEAGTAWTNQGVLEASAGTIDLLSPVGGSIMVSGGKVTGSLSGATLTGSLIVDNSTYLTITNGLTDNGTITLGDSTGYGYLAFSGTQTLNGNGTVAFGGTSTSDSLLAQTNNTTLTIGANITVTGETGYIGYDPNITGSSSNVYVVNQGTIIANTTIGVIYLDAYSYVGGALSVYGWTNNGTLEVNGGVLDLLTPVGGTIDASGVGVLGGTLNDATLNGSLTGIYISTLTITNGLTLNGKITLNTLSSSLLFSGTQTLSGSGTITFAGTGSYYLNTISTTGTLTIGPNILIDGQYGIIGYSSELPDVGTFIIQGTILENGPSGGITIAGSTNTNLNLTDTGGIEVNAGDTVSISATVNNTGDILPLTGNGTVLIDGTINGGTVDVAPSTTMNMDGTLNGVTVNGNFKVDDYNRVYVDSNLTLNGTVIIGDSTGYGSFQFNNTQTFGGNGTVIFGSTSTSNAIGLVQDYETLTIGPNITILGATGSIGGYGGVINEGTINADTSGGSISLIGSNFFTNVGTISASEGGIIALNDPIGGVITGSTGGIVSGYLSGATLSGTITLDGGRSMVITNGLTLNGTLNLGDSTGSGSMEFSSTETLGGTGSVDFTSSNSSNSIWEEGITDTLTIGSRITVHGLDGTIGSPTVGNILNQGTIQADGSGGLITVYIINFSFINSGSINATQGIISISKGAVITFASFVNDGNITVGPTGYVYSYVPFVQASSANFNVVLSGSANGLYGYATISGSAALNGNLNVSEANGFTPNIGDVYTILTASSETGQFAEYTGLYPTPTTALQPASNAGTMTLTATNATIVAPDLRIANLAISPGSLQSSGEATVNWDDVNAGNGPTGTSWTDQVLVTNTTTGQVIATGYVPYNAAANGNLTTNGSTPLSYTFQLPNGPSGVGNLQISVTTNYYNTVAEYYPGNIGSTNNTSTITAVSTLAAYPNLQVAGLTIDPTSLLQPGGTVVLDWNDANTGNAAAVGAWYDLVKVVNTTTGQTLANSTVYVNGSGNPLVSGNSLPQSFSFPLPSGAAGVANLTMTVTTDVYNNPYVYSPSGAGQTGTLTVVAPSSTIATLPSISRATFTVSWSAQSDGDLYPIAAYSIYVSDNGAPFTPWLTGTTQTSSTFAGAYGNTYGFYSIATDSIGNLQATPSAAQATTLVQASSSVAVSSNYPQGSVYGQAVTFSATVTASPSAAGVPTGSIEFQIDGANYGTAAPLSNGIATLSASSLSAGTHTITATYTSNSNSFGNSTASPISQVIVQDSTAIMVNSLLNPIVFGEAATFSATISSLIPGAGTPTGTATFYDGLAPLGTESLVDGSATFATSALAVGSHSISATYSGDSNFLASTSPVTVETVQTAVSPVASVVINNGQQQRSMLTSITVTFTGVVDPSALTSAFTLTRAALPNGEAGDNASPGTITVTPSTNASGNTIATLTFSGANTDAGSLGDGNWTFTIDAAKITAGGLTMSSDYQQTGIKRLFGDYNGTGTVDSTDLGTFGTTFGLTSINTAFIAAFDSDGNGIIDSTDLGAFGTRFGLTI